MTAYPQGDWRFDVGVEDGKFVVKPWASTIPAKGRLLTGITRSDLEELAKAIHKALRKWPSPATYGD